MSKVWAAIPNTLASLEWEVKEMDNEKHFAKVKTKPGFMLFSSTLLINAVSVDHNICRVILSAETPVTTITAMMEFGRASERVDLFFETLAKYLTNHENSATKA